VFNGEARQKRIHCWLAAVEFFEIVLGRIYENERLWKRQLDTLGIKPFRSLQKMMVNHFSVNSSVCISCRCRKGKDRFGQLSGCREHRVHWLDCAA
jgi:hypothetical protein